MKPKGLFRAADKTVDAPAGTVIFNDGDAGDAMFGVIEGSVQLTHNGAVIAEIGEGDVFGEMALVDASPRMATATASVDTQLAVIDKRHFLFLVTETPMFALQVMGTMAERLRRYADSQ